MVRMRLTCLKAHCGRQWFATVHCWKAECRIGLIQNWHQFSNHHLVGSMPSDMGEHLRLAFCNLKGCWILLHCWHLHNRPAMLIMAEWNLSMDCRGACKLLRLGFWQLYVLGSQRGLHRSLERRLVRYSRIWEPIYSQEACGPSRRTTGGRKTSQSTSSRCSKSESPIP